MFKHTKYTVPKSCVDICARHERGAIEICLSEKGALAKKRLGNTGLNLSKKFRTILFSSIQASRL